MGINICEALPEEAHEYASCHIACWSSAYKGIVPDDYLENMRNETEQRAEKYKENFNELTESSYYCAKFENRIIGILFFGKSRDDDKPCAGEVFAIYLLEDFWNKGYGWQMMDYAVNMLKSRYREIIVWVFEENRRARRFYEKYGFSADGAKKEITTGKPLILVRYVLKLPQTHPQHI